MNHQQSMGRTAIPTMSFLDKQIARKNKTMKIGDQVTYTPHDKQYGMMITGALHSVDEGYRAYIISDKDIYGIRTGDMVKVLLREGDLA